MAVPGSVNPMMLGGGAPAVYSIDQSLRFNSADSYTFRRTPSSNSTSQKKFTVSAWVKRGVLATGTTSGSGRQSIFYTGLLNGSGNMFGLEWNDNGLACVFDGGGVYWPKTVAKFRDPSAWYHIVAAVDTAQATTADRFRLYVNNVEQTVTGTLPTLDFLVANGTTSIHSLDGAGTRGNQYIAELYYINDQQLTPSDFGETNAEGVWIPKAYAGTFTGTNSCYLKFDPSATNGIGHDHSGNSNNFTTTNFTTSGTGTDVLSDTPTTNWCTLNPLAVSNTTRSPSDGNLVMAFGGTYPTNALGSFGVSSGKWYWEVGFAGGTSGNGHACGVAIDEWSKKNVDPYNQTTPNHYIDSRQYFYNSGTATANSTSFGPGDIIGIALDVDNDQVSFYKNGTIIGSAQSLETGQTWHSFHKNSSVTALTQTVNFGQRAFAYTPPTNFEALNTANLPAPDIANGSDYFNTVIYTGTGSTNNDVTTVGFQPDFTWVKDRTTNGNFHRLHDSVRGVGYALATNNTAAENNFADYFGPFLSSGFRIAPVLSASSYNTLNNSYVAWNWLAANGTSSNTDGSITSTVSATPTAGFSIVSYVGNNTTGATIGHKLGVAPNFIVVKDRDSSAGWQVYHSKLGATKYLRLDDTSAATTDTNRWNDTEPTSTVFSVGTAVGTNGNSGNNYIAYCFAEVEGYSKFGSYTGNGLADGPCVWCGFKPKFVMAKLATTSGWWVMVDSARNSYNVVDDELVANGDQAENGVAITTAVDFTANGFKIRTSDANWNSNTQTLIFAAFAEHPFGGSGVSPATAR